MILSYLPDSPFQIELSFSAIIGRLEKIASDPFDLNSARAQDLLKKTLAHPELKNGITELEQIDENEELIAGLLTDIFPEMLTLNEIKAVTVPFTKILINPTTRFKNILQTVQQEFEINIRDLNEHQLYVSSCCIILNAIYKVPLDFSRPLFADIPASNGVQKHYRIMYNADYLDIIPTKKSVSLTQGDIERLLNNYDDLDLWKSKFPPNSWILKGFAVMNLYDATIENAVSLLKEKLLVSNMAGFRSSIESIFRSIFKIPDLGIGFTIFNQEQDTFDIVDFGEPMKSFILGNDKSFGPENIFCSRSYHCLMDERRYYAVSNTDDFLDNDRDNNLVCRIKSHGVRSFILAPVVKEKQLMGILEIVSVRTNELNSVNAHKLDMLMPFLTDTIDRLISDFGNQVQAIIQKNYTSIHASVYWKFSQEAQNLIRAGRRGEEYMLKEIILNDVYPLYGQIDIKDSSDMRNEFTRLDLQSQLQDLHQLLNQIEQITNDAHFQSEREMLDDYLEILKKPVGANAEQQIRDFLESKLHPHLHQFADREVSLSIDDYLLENDKLSGKYFTNRRKYETSISMINNKLALYLDKSEASAQAIFPHYYERFKTDGVEHNLYIGSSISPNLPFDQSKLRELRLWQLRILCKMGLAHQKLKSYLPHPFDVTTLVLAYHSSITLRFRMDEKRFDVDGSYNARYEVVKKRIDKAFVKNTSERITQSGKVTIVFAGKAEEKDYLQYISVLHNEGLLEEQVERLAVENLQGVTGLHALRVTLKHE